MLSGCSIPTVRALRDDGSVGVYYSGSIRASGVRDPSSTLGTPTLLSKASLSLLKNINFITT